MGFFKRIQSKRTARIVIEGIIHLGDFFCQDPRVRPFLNQALKCHQLRGLPSTPSFMHHGPAQRIKTGGQIIRYRNLLARNPHAAHHPQIVGIVVFRVRRGTQWQLKNDARTPKRRFVPFASHREAFPQQTIFQSKQQGFNRQIPRNRLRSSGSSPCSAVRLSMSMPVLHRKALFSAMPFSYAFPEKTTHLPRQCDNRRHAP